MLDRFSISRFSIGYQPMFALLVADRVEVEHVRHVAGGHSHVAGLDATDLGRRALELLAHLINGQLGSLTQPTQFAREPSATHRRALTSPHPPSPLGRLVNAPAHQVALQFYPEWLA